MHKFRKKFKKLLSIGAIFTLSLSFALPIHAERHEYDSSLMVACQFGSFADLDVAIKKGARFAMPDWKFAKAIAEGNRTKILELKDEDRVYWNANVVNIQIQTMCDHNSPVITDEYLNFLLVNDILYKGHRNVYAYALDHEFNKTIKSFKTLNPDINKISHVDSDELEKIFKENDFTKLEEYINNGLETNDLLYELANADDWNTPHNPDAIFQMANFLLEHGADPNYTKEYRSNKEKITTLCLAAKYANARLVHFLIEHGADPKTESFICDPYTVVPSPHTAYKLCLDGCHKTDERTREQTYLLNLLEELNDGKPLKPYNQEEVDNSPTELTWSQICGCNIL